MSIGEFTIGGAAVGGGESAGAAFFSISPSSGVVTGTIAITASGVGTTWGGTNPFSVTGTGSPSISGYANISATSATFNLTLTAFGAFTIADANSGTTKTYVAAAVVAPGAPTIGAATGGNTTASVAFTPGSTGGGSVTYTATSSPGGLTGTGSASPVSVTGLTNGTAYTFSVVATNAAGSSAASAASNSVVPSLARNKAAVAPFIASDVITAASCRAYSNVAGTMTASGSVPTPYAIASVTNGYGALVGVVANGAADDSFHGVVIWSTGTQSFADELNIEASYLTYTASATVTKICTLPPGTDLTGAIGYQVRNSANTAVGGRVTTGILAIPGVVGGLCADISGTPGFSGLIVWDNGGGVYSTDDLAIPGVAQPAATKSVSLTLTTDGTTPAASLSGLKWAFFDNPAPQSFGSPTAQGSGATTNSSGVLALTVNTALAAGGIGWLIVTNSDGTTGQSPAAKAFSGPVVVA